MTKKMRVLVACEESQTVTKEFRRLGHEAYSCDIVECSGGHPEWHIRGDALKVLNPYQIPVGGGEHRMGIEFYTNNGQELHTVWGKWDLIIAHPPCTYLTVSGACNIPKHPERIALGYEAADFFMKFIYADCEKIVVENPIPMKRFNLPQYTQLIRAYQVGENHNKPYCLWIKGLNPLLVDKSAEKPKAEVTWVHKATGKRKSCSKWYNTNTRNHSAHSSKTPVGLAKAMAEQWGG